MARSIKNLIASVLISISGYLLWTQVLPDYTIVNFLKAEVISKTDVLNSRSETIKKIQNLRQDSSSKYTALQRLALVVPDKRNISELITELEEIYSNNGFILPAISLGDLEQDPTSQVAKIGFEGGAIGTYSQFLSFLGSFQKSIRLFDISTIDIGSGTGVGLGGGNDPQLTFNMNGQFYWLRPAESVVTPGGTSSGAKEAP